MPSPEELMMALSSPPGGAAPLPALPVDPMMDPMAGAPPGDDPAALAAMLGGGMPGMAAPAPAFPSADPMAMGDILAQIIEMQNADHESLAMQQQQALVSNPMFEALISGAPLEPGMGQDGQGIGPMGGIPPEGL